jgi:hypothetical protein
MWRESYGVRIHTASHCHWHATLSPYIFTCAVVHRTIRPRFDDWSLEYGALLIRDGFAADKERCVAMHLADINDEYCEIQSMQRMAIFTIRKKVYEHWSVYEPRLQSRTSGMKYNFSDQPTYTVRSPKPDPVRYPRVILRVLSFPLPIILPISPVFTACFKWYWRFSETALLATLWSNRIRYYFCLSQFATK